MAIPSLLAGKLRIPLIGNEFVVRSAARLSFENHQPPFSLFHPTFKENGLAFSQRLAIAYFTTCCVRHQPLLVRDVTRNVIKSRVDDAAVDRIFPAEVILARCEFSRTGITFNMVSDVQANRIVFAAGKAHALRRDFLVRQRFRAPVDR